MEKLFVIYQPKFSAAKFVIDGIALENVKAIPLELRRNRFSYALYGIFLFLHMFWWAHLFRYTRNTRKSLSEAVNGKILFWDCCGFKEYRVMDRLFRTSRKDVFLWNPLSRWSSDKSYIKKSIRDLMHRSFKFYTFDPNDAFLYKLLRVRNVNRKIICGKCPVLYDFYFLGYPKKRRKMIEALKCTLEAKGFRTHFIFVEKKEDYISNMENVHKSAEARCIVDILSPGQSGLSLRAFDALFLKKKLITNCSEIEKMDFYRPSNIYIIRDSKLEGLEEFMRIPYQDVDAEIVEQYEVNRWLRSFMRNSTKI